MRIKIALFVAVILGLALLSLPCYALDLAPTIADNITTRSAIYYSFDSDGVQYAQTANILNFGEYVSINAGYGIDNTALGSAELNLTPIIKGIPYIRGIFNTPIIGKYISPSAGGFAGAKEFGTHDSELKYGLIVSAIKIN